MPLLYLMLGYPGSGKTTTSRIIHDLTGATHIWADKIRREMFEIPTYTHDENLKLYKHLNQEVAELLAADNSVIFDTNFNYYKDRQHMREIAKAHNSDIRLIWVKTPKEIAQKRALHDAHLQDTRILGNMPLDYFERSVKNLQPPRTDEPYIKIDGTKVTKEYVRTRLGL